MFLLNKVAESAIRAWWGSEELAHPVVFHWATLGRTVGGEMTPGVRRWYCRSANALRWSLYPNGCPASLLSWLSFVSKRWQQRMTRRYQSMAGHPFV